MPGVLVVVVAFAMVGLGGSECEVVNYIFRFGQGWFPLYVHHRCSFNSLCLFAVVLVLPS